MSLGPDVRVRLTAEGEAQVVNALRQVVRQAEATGRGAARGFGPFNKALQGARDLLRELLPAASAIAFVALIKNATQAADELGKMSQRVGASVKNLSALSLVARESDIDIGQLTNSMVFMTRQVAALESGSKDAVKTFSALGLTARDFKGKDAAENLGLIAAKFVELKDSPQKTALGFSIFGRSVAAILPLLNQLGGDGGLQGAIDRAREFGILISDSTAKAAQAIADDFKVIQAQVVAGAQRFVEGLAPAVHGALGTITGELAQDQDAWIEWGRFVGKAVLAVLPIVSALAQFVDNAVTAFKELAIAASGSAAALALAITGQFKTAKLALSETADELRRVDDEAIARGEARNKALGNAAEAGALGVFGLPKLRPVGKEEAPVIPAAEKKVKELKLQPVGPKELKLQPVGPEDTRAAFAKAQIEAQIVEFERERGDIQQKVNAGILTEEEGRKSLQKIQVEELRSLEKQLALYQALVAADPADVDAVARVKALKGAIDDLQPSIIQTATLLQELRTTIKDSLKSALVDAFTTGIRQAKSFLGVLQQIALAVVDSVQQLLALRLAESIVGAILPTPKLGHAEGGLIEGPGTGTSDSIPARLSAGEYVVRASAVEQRGVLSLLESINRGGATPVLSEPLGASRRFAGGGFVSGAGVSRNETAVTLRLSEGLVASEIETPAGQRAVVRVVNKNRRAVGR